MTVQRSGYILVAWPKSNSKDSDASAATTLGCHAIQRMSRVYAPSAKAHTGTCLDGSHSLLEGEFLTVIERGPHGLAGAATAPLIKPAATYPRPCVASASVKPPVVILLLTRMPLLGSHTASLNWRQ